MNFPDDWREFLHDYSFKDTEEIYTNGSELMPVFRVEQLIEHLELNQKIQRADEKEQEAIESIDFGDKTEIMANLEGLTWDDWRMYHSDTEVQNIAKSAFDLLITLMKEQEAVTPYIDIDEAKCPICGVKLTRQELLGNDVLFEDFFDYCPHCGQKVKWND